MKKILSSLLCLCLMLSVMCIYAHGEELSDGTYEVSVTLMHKQDEKESFGNKYIAQKALLDISHGEKTVTILLTTNMSGIAFSYYLDGSIDGDTAEAVPVSNITVDGENYEQGFEIPVVKDGDIGLKFSVPVMPMSPSARLRIDYSTAKLVRAKEVEETTKEAATTTTMPIEESSTSSSLQGDESTTKEAAIESTTVSTTTTTLPASAVVPAGVGANEDTKKDESLSACSMVMVLAFILGACALGVLIVSKREDEKI